MLRTNVSSIRRPVVASQLSFIILEPLFLIQFLDLMHCYGSSDRLEIETRSHTIVDLKFMEK